MTVMLVQSQSSDSLSDDQEEDEEEEDKQHFHRNIYSSRSLPQDKSKEQPCRLQNRCSSVSYRNHSPSGLSRHTSHSKDHPFLFREHRYSFMDPNAQKAVIKPQPVPVEIQTSKVCDDKKEKVPFAKRLKNMIMKHLKNEFSSLIS